MDELLSPGRVRARVSRAALRHNWQQLCALAPDTPLWPVIKADGYGHGALRVARALPGADGFAVAAFSEAAALRHSGLTAPLLVLGGVQSEAEWDYCAAESIQVVVHNTAQWTLLRERPGPACWLKFDTGMGRLGFAVEDAAQMAAVLAAAQPATVAGIMTHLASAEEQGSAQTDSQLAAFAMVRAAFPQLPVSIANSAGLLAWPAARVGLLRPGLALYGIEPRAGSAAAAGISLRPALRLEARVMAVKSLPAGAKVGYGATWVCPQATTLAIVSAGYADGVRRGLENTGYAVCAASGLYLPLRGRISMDMLTVELPDPGAVMVGDWVGLWGAGATPVSEVADQLGTIPYELLTALGGRVAHEDAD